MQAAQNGHLELLKYLQSASCPWDYRTTRAAAERGDLTMLAWLRQEHTTGTTGRCPWNSDTALGCCSKGQMDALIWMRHHSDAGDPVPYDTGCCAAAALIGRLDLLQYLGKMDVPGIRILVIVRWKGHNSHCYKRNILKSCNGPLKMVARGANGNALMHVPRAPSEISLFPLQTSLYTSYTKFNFFFIIDD